MNASGTEASRRGSRGSRGATARGPRTVASLERALAVVDHLATLGTEGVSLGELAADLGLNKSTLHHTLATLRARGWVEQTEAGVYRLGPATAALAAWWTSSERLVSQLHPTLAAIGAQVGELVHLGRLSDEAIVYLDKVEPDRPIRVRSLVGRRVPAATTALGRAILASRGVAGPALDTFSDAAGATRGLKARVRGAVTAAAATGYAVEREESEAGIACVAVAFDVLGQCRYAVSVTAPIDRLPPDREADLAAAIRAGLARSGVEGLRVVAPSSGVDHPSHRIDS